MQTAPLAHAPLKSILTSIHAHRADATAQQLPSYTAARQSEGTPLPSTSGFACATSC
jgi:hypothetical protein